ncbi:MAG: DJ-1/PfpI family protein, partial [Desulfosarcinaceae bacterium]
MATIAVLIDDMFEDSEYGKPAEAFLRAGHTLIHVGIEAGKSVIGKQAEMSVDIDRAASEVRTDDFDALLIPGGYSPDKLRVHKAAVAFTRDFVQSGNPVFSICHAPQ